MAVVDCDFPQYSIKDMWERDMTSATGDDHYKAMAYEQFKRLQKGISRDKQQTEDAPDNAAKLVKSGQPLDFIFFDLPGTINNASIVNTIATMDHIFCPIAADRVVMESSIRFTIIHEHMISTGKTQCQRLYMP